MEILPRRRRRLLRAADLVYADLVDEADGKVFGVGRPFHFVDGALGQQIGAVLRLVGQPGHALVIGQDLQLAVGRDELVVQRQAGVFRFPFFRLHGYPAGGDIDVIESGAV